MRLARLSQFLALSTAAALAGCVPATTTVVPRVSGRVVDAMGTPIGSAEVKIVHADSPNEKPRKINTDAQGRFHRSEEKRWFLALPVAAHGLEPEFIAAASHQGKESVPQRFGGDQLRMQQFLGVTNPSKGYDLGDLMIYGDRDPSPPRGKPLVKPDRSMELSESAARELVLATTSHSSYKLRVEHSERRTGCWYFLPMPVEHSAPLGAHKHATVLRTLRRRSRSTTPSRSR